MNLKKIFNFIKEKRGYNEPFIYKLFNDIPFDKYDLVIKDDLYLSRRDNIPNLPNNLTVTGDLFLTSTNIKSLPNNLTIGDDLFCSNTLISEIPNNLSINNGLYIRNTPLSEKYSKEEIKKMIEDKGGKVDHIVK